MKTALILGASVLALSIAAAPAARAALADNDMAVAATPAMNETLILAKSGSGKNGDGKEDRDRPDHDANDDDGATGTSGSGRDKPRVPGGSGCDDAGDVAEHPECSG